MSGFELLTVGPPSYMVRSNLLDWSWQELYENSASISLAARRAGNVGILDLTFSPLESDLEKPAITGSLTKILATDGAGRGGIKIGVGQIDELVPLLEEVIKK